MGEEYWKNYFEMIEDVRRHVRAGDRVIPSDDPRTRTLGYISHLKEWRIPLTTVMHRGYVGERLRPETARERKILQLCKTVTGRAALLMAELPDTVSR
jgi:hypothetical protein